MIRTRHTGEFKREAVKLALESDETYKVISDNLGHLPTHTGRMALPMCDC